MSQKSSFFEGIILGGVLGTILGVIFAPNTGKETREKLNKMKDHSKEYIVQNSKSKIEDALAVIEQKFEKLSEMVEILHEKEGRKKKKA